MPKCKECDASQRVIHEAFRAGWLRVTSGDKSTVTWYCQLHHPKPAPRPPRAPFQSQLSRKSPRPKT